MALSLNLTKAEQSLKLCLQKTGLLTPPRVDLAFVLDVSGSFDDEHRAGITNALLTRLVPWGVTFDPDRQLDVFTFSGGKRSAHRVGAVTTDNYEGFVQREVIGKVPGYGTGTDYAPVMEHVLREFGWLADGGGWMDRLRGKKPGNPMPKRSLVIFVTDGDNSDQAQTIEVLQASQRRNDEVYFLFIGISNQGCRFPFLDQVARQFDNTGLTVIRNLRQFTALSDDELNTALLQPELIRWLQNAT